MVSQGPELPRPSQKRPPRPLLLVPLLPSKSYTEAEFRPLVAGLGSPAGPLTQE